MAACTRILVACVLAFTLLPGAQAQTRKSFGAWTVLCSGGATGYCSASNRVKSGAAAPYRFQLNVTRGQPGADFEIALLTTREQPGEGTAIAVQVDGRKTLTLAPGEGYRRAGRSSTYIVAAGETEALLNQMRSGKRVRFHFQDSKAGGVDAAFPLNGLGNATAFMDKMQPAPRRRAAMPPAAPVTKSTPVAPLQPAPALPEAAPATSSTPAPVQEAKPKPPPVRDAGAVLAPTAPARIEETKPKPAPAQQTEAVPLPSPVPPPARAEEAKPKPSPAQQTQAVPMPSPAPPPARAEEAKPKPSPAQQAETVPAPAPAAPPPARIEETTPKPVPAQKAEAVPAPNAAVPPARVEEAKPKPLPTQRAEAATATTSPRPEGPPAASKPKPTQAQKQAAVNTAPSASRKRGAKSIRQFSCRGNEPFWTFVIDSERARYSSLTDSGQPDSIELTGKLNVTGDGPTPTIDWRGKSDWGGSFRAVVVEEACHDSMSDSEGKTEFEYRAQVTLPGGKSVRGCCNAGLPPIKAAAPTDTTQYPVADVRSRPETDWSRYLFDLLPAIQACIDKTPEPDPYATKAWPMDRGMVGVRTRNGSGGWFECIAEGNGKSIERFVPLPSGAPPAPNEDRVVFSPPDHPPPPGNCYRHERVMDGMGDFMGWLSTNGCS